MSKLFGNGLDKDKTDWSQVNKLLTAVENIIKDFRALPEVLILKLFY